MVKKVVTEQSRSSKQDGEIDMFNGLRKAIDTVKSYNNAKTIGVEIPFVTVPIWRMLTALWDSGDIKDSSIVFCNARRIKTPWEIKMLKIAAQHCERTMYRVAQDIKPGMLCCEIDTLTGKHGFNEDKYFTADRSLFATEAAGPYFGLSGIQRGYEVKEGDIIRFDGGFRHLGYASDLARCFCVGDNPEPKAIEIYDALLNGYRAGVEMIKPGVRMKDIYDTVIRKVTSSKAIPAYPRGHVGHSIGMNNLLEEWPQISANMEEVLLPGMVISFETPIWTTGMSEHYGSFAIEDTFAITETGAERFTFGNESLIWK